MINFENYVTKEKIKEHNPNWPQFPDFTNRILITGGFWSGKTNSLFNLLSQQLDIYKTSLHAKDLYEAKFQFLIDNQESTGLQLNEYSNDMDDF